MTPAAGEIWLADSGDEIRRPVFVMSDSRFHRLAGRAVVAPVVERLDGELRPWQIEVDDGRIAGVHQMATVRIDWLLERDATLDAAALALARRAARFIIG